MRKMAQLALGLSFGFSSLAFAITDDECSSRDGQVRVDIRYNSHDNQGNATPKDFSSVLYFRGRPLRYQGQELPAINGENTAIESTKKQWTYENGDLRIDWLETDRPGHLSTPATNSQISYLKLTYKGKTEHIKMDCL